MNSGWKSSALGDLCNIELGKTPARGNLKFWDKEKATENVWLSIADMPKCHRAVIHDSKEYISDEGSALCKIVKEGTLMVSFKLTIGRLAVAGRDIYTNEAIAALTIKDESLISKDYLYFYLTFFDWEKAAEGEHKVKGKTLNKAKLKLINIVFPEPEEQKRIVAILDEAFAGIDTAVANTEKNLANARELFDSYLLSLFNEKHEKWEDYELGDLCDFLNGFAFKSKDTVEKSNVQLIRMGNLYQNNLDLGRKPAFYPEKFADEFERYRLNEGDLIISLTGTVDKEDYGYTVEIPRTDRVLLLNQRIAKFANIDTSLIDKFFLLFVLRSRFFLDALYASARGVRQANLSTVSMKKLTVSIPPISEQQQIVKNLSQIQNDIQRLQVIYQEKLNSLNELKQSLLQKAFSGELTTEGDKLMVKAVA